jgi:hypothetical protein
MSIGLDKRGISNKAKGDEMKFWVAGGTLKHSGKWPTSKIAAIEASIAKWKAIASTDHSPFIGPVENHSATSCALCNLYAGMSCGECPVKLFTGRDQCRKTPYAEYSNWFNTPTVSHRSAASMVRFLEKVLVAEREKNAKRRDRKKAGK